LLEQEGFRDRQPRQGQQTRGSGFVSAVAGTQRVAADPFIDPVRADPLTTDLPTKTSTNLITDTAHTITHLDGLVTLATPHRHAPPARRSIGAALRG
jgi:hypothetical protein